MVQHRFGWPPLSNLPHLHWDAFRLQLTAEDILLSCKVLSRGSPKRTSCGPSGGFGNIMESETAGKSKVLLSGFPGSGKTTLIERLIGESGIPVRGFITREIRECGVRVGFQLIGLSGQRRLLAHMNMKSSERIGKYGIDTDALESVLEAEFREDRMYLAVIDEIGKMELLSHRFRSFISELWRTDRPVVATIMSARNVFCDRLKADENTVMIGLNSTNRDQTLSILRCAIRRLTGHSE